MRAKMGSDNKNASRPARWAAVTLAALICVFALAACQPTPGKEVVINQQRDYLETLVTSEQFVKTDAPARVDEAFRNPATGLTVRFAADIEVPEVDTYAVLEVEEKTYSDEELLRLFDYFKPEAILFQEIVYTKDQWLEQIMQYRNAGSMDESYIQHMTEQMNAAPDVFTPVAFSLDSVQAGGEYRAYCDNGDNTYAMFYGFKNGSRFSYAPDIEAYCAGEDTIDPLLNQELMGDYEGEFPLSADSALPKALEVLEVLGFSDAELIGSQKSREYKHGIPSSKCWEFTFTHGNHGLKNIFRREVVMAGGDGLPAPVLVAPWSQEVIKITIGTAGVLYVDVQGAISYKQELARNVVLLNFDELKLRIREHFLAAFFYLPERMDDAAVEITRMELCTALVAAKDKPDAGRLIPAWRVTFATTGKMRAFTDGYGVYHPSETFSDPLSRYFSAINGIYIEPRITGDYLG